MYANYDMENPSCFGTDQRSENCVHCKFKDACEFAFSDTQRTEKQNARWKYANEYIDNIGPKESGYKLPVDIEADRLYTRDEMVAWSAFLLRLGHDRKLGKIISAKLMGARSFAEIARREGVTRQAIHKRIGKQLAKLFGFKKRRLTDSRLMTLEVNEFAMLKMTRQGYTDDEIGAALSMRTRELKQLRESLEWKLIRPT